MPDDGVLEPGDHFLGGVVSLDPDELQLGGAFRVVDESDLAFAGIDAGGPAELGGLGVALAFDGQLLSLSPQPPQAASAKAAAMANAAQTKARIDT